MILEGQEFFLFKMLAVLIIIYSILLYVLWKHFRGYWLEGLSHIIRKLESSSDAELMINSSTNSGNQF